MSAISFNTFAINISNLQDDNGKPSKEPHQNSPDSLFPHKRPGGNCQMYNFTGKKAKQTDLNKLFVHQVRKNQHKATSLSITACYGINIALRNIK